MSKTKIEKYIEKVEQEFVLNFEAETEIILKQKRETFEKEVKELRAKTLDKTAKEQKDTIATTKQALEFEEKSKGEALKSLMIEEIYEDTYTRITSLDGRDLLEFVALLLAKENFKGEHRLLVKKGNFDKYNKALSKKDNADLLNEMIKGAKFTLEIYDDAVDQGFIVEDKEFDIYFDFKTILEKHKQAHAFEIYQKLFGDK